MGPLFDSKGHGVEPLLQWRSDGTVSVVLDGRDLVILALATDLRAGSEKQVSEALAQLNEAMQSRPTSQFLILYLSSGEDQLSFGPNLSHSLHTVGNDPRSALSGGGCLPVSPWEIGSMERPCASITLVFNPYAFSGLSPAH